MMKMMTMTSTMMTVTIMMSKKSLMKMVTMTSTIMMMTINDAEEK